jgi:hypothetical protein
MAIFECLHACRNKWSCKHQHFSVFCEQTWKILVSNIFGYIHAYNICYNAVKTQIVPSLRDLSKKFSLLGIFKPHFEDLCAVARSVLPKTFTQPRPHLEKWKKIYVLIGIYLRRFWLTIGNRDWHPKTARISVVFSRVFGNSCLLGFLVGYTQSVHFIYASNIFGNSCLLGYHAQRIYFHFFDEGMCFFFIDFGKQNFSVISDYIKWYRCIWVYY